MFRDREDAGIRLALKLMKFKNENPLIIALPRGGVPVGYEIAKGLEAELDIIIVRKLGAPYNPELAVGALVEGEPPQVVRNENIIEYLGVTEEFLQESIKQQNEEIVRRQKLYREGKVITNPEDRTVILVDDGIATGATMKVALKGIKAKKPEKIIVAVPVGPPDVIHSLREEADEVICLNMPQYLYAIGEHYEDFSQTTDEEVVVLLSAAKKFVKAK